jgi:hypothetical protein
MGENFSWGAGQIIKCMEAKFRGTPSNWLAIDTNHHIAWVMLEVEEFVLQLTAVKHQTEHRALRTRGHKTSNKLAAVKLPRLVPTLRSRVSGKRNHETRKNVPNRSPV